MVDYLFQAALSNALFCAALIPVAWLVQHRFRNAAVANLLWTLVLIKFVTPPLLTLGLVPLPTTTQSPSTSAETRSVELSGAPRVDARPSGISEEEVATGRSANPIAPRLANFPSETQAPVGSLSLSTTAMSIWITGSVVCLLTSAWRIGRFQTGLRHSSRRSRRLTESTGRRIAERLGLRRVPDLWLTPAKLPPFVWWRGGRACVVLSERAIDQLGHDDLGLVIAHEYAHIRRLDHWFRWIEWGVTVACWWNPLVWYARAARRATEEQACDELVLETQGVAGRHYAHALLNMAELLVATPTRPPAIASAFNSGGCLETRVRMMILDRPIKSARLARGAILALALCLAPVGLGHAQELDAIQRRLHQAVEAGEITEDQARVMLDALRRGSQRPMREGRAERSEMIREFGAELTEAGIERDSIGPALNVARRIAAQRWEQGDEPEVSPQLIERLRDELGLNEAQTDVVLRIAHRLAERRPNPARDGETRQESRSDRDADAAARDAMVDVLREVGVEPDAIRPALATARELAEVMADQGKEFEMPDSIPIRLREQLGLNEEQVNAVIGIAKRLAAAHQGRDAGESNRHAISEKLASVLAEADVDPEAIKPVIAIVWDLAEAVTNDGADRAFNEASDNLRREFSFNDDQVNLVFTLAKQLAANKMTERSEASHGETGLAIKVAQLLTEAELPTEMIKPATDAVLRLANAMSRQADDVDLDLVRARLAEELEMNERQIDVVIGLAMKLVHERQAPERDDDKTRIDLAIPRESREGDRRSTEALQEQLRDSLAEQGFGADRIERVIGAVRRLANVMREQEDDFELTDEIVNHFREDLDLSDEQIKLALGIAKQLATETRRD